MWAWKVQAGAVEGVVEHAAGDAGADAGGGSLGIDLYVTEPTDVEEQGVGLRPTAAIMVSTRAYAHAQAVLQRQIHSVSDLLFAFWARDCHGTWDLVTIREHVIPCQRFWRHIAGHWDTKRR